MHDHDDEVTTDVDPEWIAAIREEAAAGPSDHTSPAEPASTTDGADVGDAAGGERSDGGQDWFDAELKWDAEATVGVSAGLIDRIRAEIDTERSADAPVLPPPAVSAPSPVVAAPDTPPPVAAPHVTPAPVAPAPVTPPPVAPSTEAPPTPVPVAARVPVTAADDAASTTVRWEPRQRLAMTAPVKESAAIVDDSRHTGLDRTKVVIAVIVAITVLLVVWLVSRSGHSDVGPTPEGTVPAASTPGTPVPADDAGAGG
jgi:hypothetical protein